MTSDHEIFTEPDCLEKLRAGHDRRAAGHDRRHPPRHRRGGEPRCPIPPTHLVAATDDLFALTLLDDGGHRPPPAPARRARDGPACSRPLRDLQRRVPAAARRPRSRGRRPPGRHRRARPTWTTSRSNEVFIDGRLVAAGGRMLVDVVEGPSDPPLDTMKLAPLDADDLLLRLDAPDGAHRMRVIADAVMTRWDETDVTVRDGVVDMPAGHIVQVTVHRHGRIDPVPHAALLVGLGRLDRRGRHDGRPRHPQPRGVRARPARHGARRQHRDRVGRWRRGRARGEVLAAHRAADRGHPLAAAGARGRRPRSAPCRTPRSAIGLLRRRCSPSRCSR